MVEGWYGTELFFGDSYSYRKSNTLTLTRSLQIILEVGASGVCINIEIIVLL